MQPKDVVDLVDKQRIGGELEGFFQMRLDPERVLDTHDAGRRKARLAAHAARTPVTGVVGLTLQYLIYYLLNLLIRNRAWPARARLIVQTQQSQLSETLPPPRYDILAGTQALCNVIARFAGCTSEDYFGPQTCILGAFTEFDPT